MKKFSAKEKKKWIWYMWFFYDFGVIEGLARVCSPQLSTWQLVHWYTFMDSCGTVCEEYCHWALKLYFRERGGLGQLLKLEIDISFSENINRKIERMNGRKRKRGLESRLYDLAVWTFNCLYGNANRSKWKYTVHEQWDL